MSSLVALGRGSRDGRGDRAGHCQTCFRTSRGALSRGGGSSASQRRSTGDGRTAAQPVRDAGGGGDRAALAPLSSIPANKGKKKEDGAGLCSRASRRGRGRQQAGRAPREYRAPPSGGTGGGSVAVAVALPPPGTGTSPCTAPGPGDTLHLLPMLHPPSRCALAGTGPARAEQPTAAAASRPVQQLRARAAAYLPLGCRRPGVMYRYIAPHGGRSSIPVNQLQAPRIPPATARPRRLAARTQALSRPQRAIGAAHSSQPPTWPEPPTYEPVRLGPETKGHRHGRPCGRCLREQAPPPPRSPLLVCRA
ncbi:hypothetical protein CDD83_10302 [Cordyceps sp. RAO-2017]|nr:hypothetical protein CDD83_10302 [Cordyceps sp. RAO-2017]